jgi:predicted small metal-binding protein
MKSFACGAVVPGCTATFTAETEDVLLGQVATHAREDHGMQEVPAELVAQVREKIETV